VSRNTTLLQWSVTHPCIHQYLSIYTMSLSSKTACKAQLWPLKDCSGLWINILANLKPMCNEFTSSKSIWNKFCTFPWHFVSRQEGQSAYRNTCAKYCPQRYPETKPHSPTNGWKSEDELLLLLLLFITPKQHDIQTIDITILHIENTNHANIKHSTGEIK